MPPECRDVAGRGTGVARGKPRNQSGVRTRVRNIQLHVGLAPRGPTNASAGVCLCWVWFEMSSPRALYRSPLVLPALCPPSVYF
jgi:hypothetical protein